MRAYREPVTLPLIVTNSSRGFSLGCTEKSPLEHTIHHLNDWFAVRQPTLTSRRFAEYINASSETGAFVTNWFEPYTTNAKKIIPKLSRAAYRALVTPNAGGASEFSEALSCDMFVKMYGGKYVRTEMEIEHWYGWKLPDMVLRFATTALSKHVLQVEEQIRGRIEKRKYVNVGISVTRAMAFPSPDDFTLNDADVLLRKKLNGLVVARAGVYEKDAFYKSVLHIWAQNQRIAGLLNTAYESLPANIRDNVLVICTVAESLPCIFTNAYGQHDANKLSARPQPLVGYLAAS